MAKTKQELTDFMASRLFQSNYQELIWTDLTAAVGGLSQGAKDKIMEAILKGQEAAVGKFLHDLMIDVAKDKSSVEATAFMADDNLTLIEMQRIFV